MREPATIYSMARCGFEKAQISRKTRNAEDAVTLPKEQRRPLALEFSLFHFKLGPAPVTTGKLKSGVREGSITKVSAAVVLFLMAAGCSSGPPPVPVDRRGIRRTRDPQNPQRHSFAIRAGGYRQARRPSGNPAAAAEVFPRAHASRAPSAGRMSANCSGQTTWPRLRDLAKRASRLPVQGRATTYGDLNVHTQPSRQSPSFLQVKENDKLDVLEHVITPRVDLPRKPLLPPAPKKKKAPSKKKPAKESKYPPPPMPKPPPPPENWLDLSKTEPEEPAPVEEEPDEKPTPTDEWSLVRTAAGQSGWVLTRRLIMAIPDEVAQYAEGRRIVSYFSLGTVLDGDEKKNIWLWTTVSDGARPYDFDSFRVFIWSLRKHRYETAYIERNMKGYAPVLQREVDFGAGKAAAKYPGFSICMEKKDGQRVRREYALLGNVVRFAGEQPCEAQTGIGRPRRRVRDSSRCRKRRRQKEGWLERMKKTVPEVAGGLGFRVDLKSRPPSGARSSVG